MKIKSIHSNQLRNDEHFQFNTEFKDLVNKFDAAELKIGAQFNDFLALFKQEDEALKKIMKSAFTLDLQDLDKRRDRLFRGIIGISKTALHHFNEEVQEAGRRLKILLDTYGNIARKPMNEATSAIYNILQELNGKYAPDVALMVGLTDWVTELETCNGNFDQLMKNRYEESAMKSDLVLKECRQKVDEAYQNIVERINALVVIEGEADYKEFIRNLNIVIEKYTVILAHRRGVAAAKKTAVDSPSPTLPEGEGAV